MDMSFCTMSYVPVRYLPARGTGSKACGNSSGRSGLVASPLIDTDRSDSDAGIDLQGYLAKHYAHLHHRLTRHLGCPDLASDGLHDAWLRLGDKGQVQIAQSPEAYVYRVACNLAMDRLRSNRSWQYTSDADTELEYFADPAPGPEFLAEVRSDLAAVDRALERLPRRHQDILVCLRLEEATRQEVAARHGISLRSVDTALRQALDHCAEQTGHSVSGGVSTPRRVLRQPRAQV